MNDLCIAIRSVNERTEQVCLQLAQNQGVKESSVHLIENVPFAEAHFESIRFAVKANKKWALFLDADILLKTNAIAEMVAEAEQKEQAFLMLNFRVLDQGFGGPTYGTHLYKVENLEKTLPLMEQVKNSQRPETQLNFKMATEFGIPTMTSEKVMGLHGYEQYYADLYRTMFVRAVKFGEKLAYFIERYRSAVKMTNRNNDDIAMLLGLIDGLYHKQTGKSAPLDKGFYREYAEKALSEIGLEEKDTLALNHAEIDQTLHNHIPDALYLANQDWICPPAQIVTPAQQSIAKRKFKEVARKSLLYFGVRAKELIKKNL